MRLAGGWQAQAFNVQLCPELLKHKMFQLQCNYTNLRIIELNTDRADQTNDRVEMMGVINVMTL